MGAFDFHSLEGLARSLNGTTDYFSRASEAALQVGAQDFGICLWVRLDAITGTVAVISKYGVAGNRAWSLYVDQTGGVIQPLMLISQDGNNTALLVPGVDLMNIETWHFLAAWWDVNSGMLYVEVDCGTTYSLATGYSAIFANTQDFEVGSAAGGLIPVDGRLTKIGLWIGSFPDAAQRAQLWNSGKGLTWYTLPDALRTNLVGWWGGDEISGSLLDAGGTYPSTAAGAPGTADGPDIADVLTLAHPKRPDPEVDRPLPVKNSVVAITIGGRDRSESRGPDRRIYRPKWTGITAAHVTLWEAWWARYGASAEPFYLELPDASRLRVRAPQTSIPCRYMRKNTLFTLGPIELVEDIL